MNQEEQGKKMSKIIAKCWADEGFKQKLLADPAATLKAEGMELPPGLSVKALENITGEMFYLVIPAKPTDLTEEDLIQLKTMGTIDGPKCDVAHCRCWLIE